MISYADNFEDVYIQRVFADQEKGFYIDIGAAHPVEGSITRHFYDQGWRGINVEPLASYHAMLQVDRPRDLNLRVAVGSQEGTATFYNLGDAGGSTLSAETAEETQKLGFELKTETIQVTTLRHICERHVKGPIDFIKIDVEGLEREVISGGDWTRFRPTLVVVEATRPFRPEPCHETWEPLLLEAGYAFAFFDGLNRYYLQVEEMARGTRLALPANVFDRFVPYRQYAAEKEAALLRARLSRGGWAKALALRLKDTVLYGWLKGFERRVRRRLKRR